MLSSLTCGTGVGSRRARVHVVGRPNRVKSARSALESAQNGARLAHHKLSYSYVMPSAFRGAFRRPRRRRRSLSEHSIPCLELISFVLDRIVDDRLLLPILLGEARAMRYQYLARIRLAIQCRPVQGRISEILALCAHAPWKRLRRYRLKERLHDGRPIVARSHRRKVEHRITVLIAF